MQYKDCWTHFANMTAATNIMMIMVCEFYVVMQKHFRFIRVRIQAGCDGKGELDVKPHKHTCINVVIRLLLPQLRWNASSR